MDFFSRPLIEWTPQGLYCSSGGFYIDPLPRRERATLPPLKLAVITHAHSDHARRGSERYLCEKSGLGLLRTRLGRIEASGIAYGEKVRLGDVWVSFHSAGHILGSAQVRVEGAAGSAHEGEVWVASGDYKRDPDPSCEPFEVVECDTFITEATFGTRKYAWEKGQDFGRQIIEWWEQNCADGVNTVVFGYSLGKAQRVLAELAPHARKPVLIHSTVCELTECYRREGRVLAPTVELEAAAREARAAGRQLSGEIVLAPPSALRETWASALGGYRTAFASGWMAGGSRWGHGGGYDHGFVMSDHADWNDLNQTIRETRARRVYVQHRNGLLVRHLRKQGIEAHPVEELSPENWARRGGETLDLFGGLEAAGAAGVAREGVE